MSPASHGTSKPTLQPFWETRVAHLGVLRDWRLRGEHARRVLACGGPQAPEQASSGKMGIRLNSASKTLGKFCLFIIVDRWISHASKLFCFTDPA